MLLECWWINKVIRMHGLTKSFCYNYLLKLNHEKLLYTVVSNTVAFTDYDQMNTHDSTKIKGFSEKLSLCTCNLERHRKSVSLNFVETNSSVF